MLEQMCRTCLATSGELVSMFSNDYYVHNLPDKLLHTTRIEVAQDDDLPKMMCKKCIFLVDSLYCFKDQCEMAEIKLKKTLNKTQTKNVNVHLSPVKKGPGFHDDDYERIIGKAGDISDAVSSSDEDYQIEYASEEARLEVENARRRSKNKKKHENITSEVKRKPIQVVPDEPSENTNVNLVTTNEISEMDEDYLMSDVDDQSSLHASDTLKIAASKPFDKKNYQNYTITEKIEYLKNQRKDKVKEKTLPSATSSKRKIEYDDHYSKLDKVPKKVLFQDDDFNDENLQAIDRTEYKNSKIKGDKKIKMEENSIDDKFSVIADRSQTSQDYLSRINNSSQNKTLDTESQQLFKVRMEGLIKEIVLNIPEICTICSKHFESHTDVLKHKIEHHLDSDQTTFFCPICEKFFLKENVTDHLNDHEDIESFICIICSGNYYTKDTLRKHLETHVDLHVMQCKFCLKKMTRVGALAKHLDQHVSSPEMICIFCSKSFNSKDLLQCHINSQHYKMKKIEKDPPDEKIEKYPCPYCESIFYAKADLRNHVYTHLNKEQYSCMVCEKKFSSHKERTQHMQEHMKPQQKSDQKKFRCRVCHEILVSRAAYGQHLKEQHWMAKQTSEILRELSESAVNEKINESPSKSSTSVHSSSSLNIL